MWIMYAYEAPRGLTLKDAKATLKALGMSINKNQWGEYRVNFLGGDEATAYYTDDLEDAVNTGKHMAGVRPVRLMPNPSNWARQRIAELKQQRHWVYRYTASGMTVSGKGVVNASSFDEAVQKLHGYGLASSIDFNSLREISYEQMRQMLCASREWDLDDCSQSSSAMQLHENPMSKNAKMALWIGGGVAVAGIAAYFIFSKSSTTTGATGGTGGTQTGGTQTGGTQHTGGTQQPQCKPGEHYVNGKCVFLIPLRACPPGYGFSAQQYYKTGDGCTPPSQQSGQQQQGQQGPQPAPSPIVVQNGSSATYQAPAANSLLLIQLPQYSSVGSPSWTGSGSPNSLGAATSGGIPTLQLIMPGGPGTLTIPWTDNSGGPNGTATITFV